ncbi:hypothetical protein M5K25_001533 [Dendrobium thyrsiflorum]|uniref:DUF4283 domain-containing protein n=1 Tax=Dendrobium thyrsiflorum TaxID=117978 RepID=A0ABD0VQB4_DENTH
MDSPLPPSDFPPLSSISALPAPANWSSAVSTPRPTEKAFVLSTSTSPDDPLDFTEKHVTAAKLEWSLTLVGYSIGRRPFYEALLSAMRKSWKLKGMMQLLSLSDGFFMLKFTSSEDYDMALSGGVWFFLGKPFVVQKWVPNFKPKREEFSSIPIWLKILDLPLPCWTPEGISRIASKIGVPLTVDNLTAEKTRLTYARVCVQVTKECTYPESIQISILGEPFTLNIQYEWRPTPCEHCASIVHPPEICPSRPQNTTPNTQAFSRGRSTSRKPHGAFNRVSKSKHHQSISNNKSRQVTVSKQISEPSSSRVIPPPVVINPPSTDIETPPLTTQDSHQKQIPNLNSPMEVSSTSCSDTSLPGNVKLPNSPSNVISPNKFDLLQESNLDKTQQTSTSSSTENVTILPPPPPSTHKASRSKQSKKPPANHHKN